MKKKKVVLAFSGGLDTSYCAVYLGKEKNYELYTALVNTGGFSDSEIQKIDEQAISLGIQNHTCLDVTDQYYQKGIRYLIYGNVLKNNTYPLSVSAERVFQAVAITNYAIEIGADAIAHGSTGAGNDQIRFDLVFNVLAPELEIITPIRDQKLSREEEVSYLEKNGIKQEWAKAKYSVNKGLWGTSVGGAETLTSNLPLPEEAWPQKVTENDTRTIELGFKKGEPISIDGKSDSPVQIIKLLQEIAGPYGVGRNIHVGDTIIGIKGRVGFEAAAAMIIIKAHEQLEKHILGKWQIYWKDQLANWYGMMMHEGQYLDPVMRNIENFLDSTQKYVTGTAIIKLAPHSFEISGIESDYDLMQSEFGQYGEMNNAWSGEDVKGFTKILANSTLIQKEVQNND